MVDKLYYTMGEVTEMFDVEPSLIRYWCSQFSCLRPKRNAKGNRLFTKEDVETFLMDALKAEPQLLIDTLIDKIILFGDKIEIFYRDSQNNNPDDLTKEIRRDFCLPFFR